MELVGWVKVKVVPVLFFFYRAPCYEGVLGVEVYIHAFLTLALDRGMWSASRPGRFTPRERSPGTH
jgi:hypothetical protein